MLYFDNRAFQKISTTTNLLHFATFVLMMIILPKKKEMDGLKLRVQIYPDWAPLPPGDYSTDLNGKKISFSLK